mmetsp:Transcript_132383/g.295126  ORF Transcript_132383/g.295126 Transcript_132383/m.295126 type:complete len:325 (-) Transcript_132383:65-1039(-)
MTSLTQVTQELDECERQIIAIRLKAEEKRGSVVEKVTLVAKRREELLRSHRQRFEDTKKEYEAQLQSIVDNADQEIMNMAQLAEQARARTRAAEAGVREAELKARHVESEVQRLQAAMKSMTARTDMRLRQVYTDCDERVRQIEEDGSIACRDMALHASEVQEGAMETIEHMRTELRVKVEDAEVESVQRSRFQELLAVVEGAEHATRAKAASREEPAKSAIKVNESRIGVLQAWYDDWVRTNSSLGQRTVKMAYHRRSPACYEGPRGTPSPTCKDRPRSVERERQRAMQLQTQRRHCSKDRLYGYSRAHGSNSGQVGRPGTAP